MSRKKQILFDFRHCFILSSCIKSWPQGVCGSPMLFHRWLFLGTSHPHIDSDCQNPIHTSAPNHWTPPHQYYLLHNREPVPSHRFHGSVLRASHLFPCLTLKHAWHLLVIQILQTPCENCCECTHFSGLRLGVFTHSTI